MNSNGLCLKCKDDFAGMDPPIKNTNLYPSQVRIRGSLGTQLNNLELYRHGSGSAVRILLKRIQAALGPGP